MEKFEENNIMADFANQVIGGGALGFGNVQEELMFTKCPELIVSMLIFNKMENYQSLYFENFRTFSKTSGYGGGFEYDGEDDDCSILNEELNIKKHAIVAIDALDFRNMDLNKQLSEEFVLREINKAFIGFTGKLKTDDDITYPDN